MEGRADGKDENIALIAPIPPEPAEGEVQRDDREHADHIDGRDLLARAPHTDRLYRDEGRD